MGDAFGRYELVERLAVGAATERFVVRVSGEHGFKRFIAIKRLIDDSHAHAFIEDAKLAAKLSHAKIVQTLELGRIGDVPYVATEYVDGIDLLGLLCMLARKRTSLDPAIAVFVAQEMLDGLDYAHTFVDEGKPLPIVHGRLCPTNVLLGEAGEVKLSDFGTPRRFELGGGQDYAHMSPEQVAEQPLDARSDVFGVGVLLAEMLVGRRLFAARNEFDVLLAVRDVRLDRLDAAAPRIDAQLVAIVRKALAKKPDDRWPDAAAFRDALDEWSFQQRVHSANQQLAMLVTSVREPVDEWRRTNGTTAAFDDVPDPTTPPLVKPLPRGTAPPKSVAIPEKLPKASTQMQPLAKPDERTAKGTVESAPIAKPKYISDPVAQPRPSHPRVVARIGKQAGAIGKELQQLLPERAPAQPTNQTTQLLSAEQLAKAKKPLAPPLAQLEPRPDDAGDFARTPPLRVLYQLVRTRATGLLVVTREETRKDLYVRDGQLSSVWSNDRLELFGNYLVREHVLSEGELSMALATMTYYGGKIGDTLVGLGLLGQTDVFRHLNRHARARVLDVCAWTKGRYAWYADKEDPREAFPLETDSFALLGEAALALPPSVVDNWLVKHRDDRLVFSKTHRVSPDVFEVRGALQVLDGVDGTRTLGEVVQRQPDRPHAARLLYLFVACDLVRPA